MPSKRTEEEPLVIIFLDIDGVLLPFPDAAVPPGRLFPTSTLDALALLFHHIPTAQLVLSSTWRVQESFRNEILQEFAAHNADVASTATGGLPTAFYDVTDVTMHTERQHEIYHWILQQRARDCFQSSVTNDTKRRTSVAAWVALDDEELLQGTANEKFRSHFEDHVVHCDPRVGLTLEQAQCAVRMLEHQLLVASG